MQFFIPLVECVADPYKVVWLQSRTLLVDYNDNITQTCILYRGAGLSLVRTFGW